MSNSGPYMLVHTHINICLHVYYIYRKTYIYTGTYVEERYRDSTAALSTLCSACLAVRPGHPSPIRKRSTQVEMRRNCESYNTQLSLIIEATSFLETMASRPSLVPFPNNLSCPSPDTSSYSTVPAGPCVRQCPTSPCHLSHPLSHPTLSFIFSCTCGSLVPMGPLHLWAPCTCRSPTREHHNH